MEYKVSFFTSVVSMIINNSIFFLCWYFFFLRFDTIGGMNFGNFALLSSIMVMVFSIVHLFFGGYSNAPIIIEQGKLDSQLLLPKNVLLRLLASRMDGSVFGDLLYSFGLLFFVPDLTFLLVLKLLFVSFFGALAYLGFLLIFVSLAFYIGSSKGIVKGIIEAILGPGHYPPGIFEGTILKYVFMTILPVFYIVFLPYELTLDFTFKGVCILVIGCLFFLSIGVFAFYKGLKRYESGNMLNTNV